MFKSESICVECGAELISLLRPEHKLCDDCIEDWLERRDRKDPNKCVHGIEKTECEMCLQDWEM